MGTCNLGISARNRFTDTRRCQDLAIQQDGNLVAYILCGQFGKLLGSFLIELKGNDRTARLIGTCLGIFQVLTSQDRIAFHVLEFKHSRFAKHGNGLFRVLDARELNNDPVPALTLDDRFREAEFVDTALNDADGTVHGIIINFGFRCIFGLKDNMGPSLKVKALFDRKRQRLD